MFGSTALTKTEVALLSAAVAYCGVILWFDIRTATDFTEAFLYSLGLILVYPLKRSWAILFVTGVGIGFTVLGKLFEEESEPGIGGMFNRGTAILVLAAFGFLLWRIISVERTLFRLSTSDPLTGALNRRHFMALMGREQKRAERYGARYSLLMLDIDHFKRINDSFGHQIGDQAIKRMADTAMGHLRPTDMLCRYGGEEFIIALTHTEEGGARIAAERIREAVGRIEIAAEHETVRFTVSIGVSTFVPRIGLERLIECADQALYAAKTGGRNQVRIGTIPGALAPAPAAAAS
jgi:diguanylate cyclase (GGDEF)-like protein